MEPQSSVFPLSPNDSLTTKEYKVYKEILSEVFQNSKTANIAICGGFGVGKSSILRSFENDKEIKKELKKRFLYVSLLDYIKTKDTNRLEITLLRQILAYCTKSDVPSLQFRIIPEDFNFAKWEFLFVFFYICLFLSAIFSYIVLSFFKNYNQNSMSLFFWICFFLWLVFLFCTFIVIFYGIRYAVNHFKLKKVSLKISGEKTETQSEFSGHGETVLDEYRFDMIYVLEKLSGKYDAVVFEDFDRLDPDQCLSVFHQLREINVSLNLRGKAKKHPFRFIYVINDDITERLEHTKFFDYILPIVPVLGQQNAIPTFYNIIIDDLKINLSEKERKCIDNAVLITPRLKDFRTIYQIKNEYIVFMKTLKASGIHTDRCQSQLLAFVIYKVLWPQDYNSIRSGKSVVFPTWNISEIDSGFSEEIDKAKFKYGFLRCLGPLLKDSICLEFLGYSDYSCSSYFITHVLNGASDCKESFIKNDREFVFGYTVLNMLEQVKNHKYEEIVEIIRGIEQPFLCYLLKYNSSENHIDRFWPLVRKLQPSQAHVISKEYYESIKALLSAVTTNNIIVFTACYLMKLRLFKTNDESINSFDWFYTENKEKLAQRLLLLDEQLNNSICTEDELHLFFVNFNNKQLQIFRSFFSKDTRMFKILVRSPHE